MNALKYGVLLLIIPLLNGCSEEMQRNLRPVPNAYGSINEIIVIADPEIWDSVTGDTISWYFSSAYPLLPQPEPMFDLRHFSPEDLQNDPLRKELRNYLIVANMEDERSATAKMIRTDLGEEKIRAAKETGKISPIVGKDKWANGQTIVYLYDFSYNALNSAIVKHFPSIAKKFREADRVKIDATIFLDGENRSIMDEVKNKMGFNIRIPKDYFLALNDGEVMWIRKETNDLSSNLLLKKVPYTDQQQLSKEGIKAIQDSIGRKYVSSTIPNTYMRINDVDLPMLTTVTTLSNHYAVEARGIWEIVNDYMGGAFVSYLVHNPDRQELLFIEGFVHAPGKDKRNFLQYLEYIISTTRF